MSRGRIGFAQPIAIAVLWLGLSRPAAAQQLEDQLVEEPDDETRLRAWIHIRARRSERRLSSIIGLAGGLATAGAAIPYRLTIGEDADAGTWLSVALIGSGLLSASAGLAGLLLPNIAKDDDIALPDRPLTEREIGRLEGRLRLEAQLARQTRYLQLFSAVAVTLTGGAAFPLVATEARFNATDRLVGYAVAGGLVVAGVISLITSLFESEAEADWNEYQRGLMPAEFTPRVQVSATGFGVVF